MHKPANFQPAERLSSKRNLAAYLRTYPTWVEQRVLPLEEPRCGGCWEKYCYFFRILQYTYRMHEERSL